MVTSKSKIYLYINSHDDSYCKFTTSVCGDQDMHVLTRISHLETRDGLHYMHHGWGSNACVMKKLKDVEQWQLYIHYLPNKPHRGTHYSRNY